MIKIINVNKLNLRILIPKDLIKDKKVPAKKFFLFF